MTKSPANERTHSATDAAVEQALQIVQMAYPQVYLACHTRHQNARTNVHGLSSRDSAILSHLNERTPITPAKLATHLGVARSTLSEALKHLGEMGYSQQLSRAPANGERGGVGIVLTAKGLEAIRETSVLEAPRLRAALEQLSSTQLREVSRGLNALAAACRVRTAHSSLDTEKHT